MAEAALTDTNDQSSDSTVESSLAGARSASDLGDAATAARRWSAVRLQFPERRDAYAAEVAALRALARYDQADALLNAADDLARSGLKRFPDHPTLLREFALNALHGRRLEEAARRWDRLRICHPDMPEAYRICSMMLRRIGAIERADEVATAGLARFADDPDLLAEHAFIAMDQGNSDLAASRWLRLRQLAPGRRDSSIYSVICMRDAGRFAEADALMAESIAPLAQDDPSHLFMRFESLGDNCEFGLVQRHFGAEPIGLFRWGSIGPEALARTLERRFDGVGDPAALELRPVEGDFHMIVDHQTGFQMHSFVNARSVKKRISFEYAVVG